VVFTPTGPLLKKALTVTVLTGAALVGRRYMASRGAMAEVAADLRSPVLPLFTGPTTMRSLRLSRPVSRTKTRSGPGVTVSKRHVPGEPEVPVFVTVPTASTPDRRRAVLWIHGGGMILGSPQMEATGSGRFARELDAVVVAPDYRLAPEHPFPSALDDCMSTLNWMCDHADELGIDPDRIAVAGASAGGGLSAAVAQRAHDEGIALRTQALVYPMIDDRTVLRDNCGRGEFVWTPKANQFAWTAYLGRPPRLSDAPEYAAPARRTDLTGLPPAWIGVGSLDLFYDESVSYAEALQACGVRCELVTVPGMYHGADGLAGKAPAMKEFHRKLMDHLREYL
jgi:acetyl esterase/lipase